MGRSAALVCLLFSFGISQYLFSQSDEPLVLRRTTSQFMMADRGASVAPGSMLVLTSAYSPASSVEDHFTGTLLWSYRGALSLGFSYETGFGDPVRRTVPVKQAELRVQILEQRGPAPSVAVVCRSTIEKKTLWLGNDVLQEALPEFVNDGLMFGGMSFRSSELGLGMSAVLGRALTVSGVAGLRTIAWRQGDTWVRTGSAVPQDQTRKISSNEMKSVPSLIVNATGTLRLADELSLSGEVRPLPLIEIERTTKEMMLRDGYLFTAVVRYELPFAMVIAAERSAVTGYVSGSMVPQWRLSLSAALFRKE